MASSTSTTAFAIHQDQENVRRENLMAANKARAALGTKNNAANVFNNGQRQRNVLAPLENVQNNLQKNPTGKATKQPFGNARIQTRNAKIQQQKVASVQPNAPPSIPSTSVSTTVPFRETVPVAQFQAFKVYEDDKSEEDAEVIIESVTDAAVLPENEQKDIKEDIKDDDKVIDVGTIETPMSVDKSVMNMSVDMMSPCSRSRAESFYALEEYRNDIYQYLRQHERRHRPKSYYMRKQPDITDNMRTILVDWLVEVAQEYKLQTETLFLAVAYIDRFLSVMSVVRAKLQLLGTAAMFLASKYEEIYPPDVGEFVYITDDTYSKKQVIRMEILILKVLDFDLSTPTSYTFITCISISCKVDEKVKFLAQYLCELSLLEAEPALEISPSILACSAIALSRHTLGEAQMWTEQLEEAADYCIDDLINGIKFLHSMHVKAATLPQRAIQDKYNSENYMHVASIQPVESLGLGFD